MLFYTVILHTPDKAFSKIATNITFERLGTPKSIEKYDFVNKKVLYIVITAVIV